MKKKIQLVDGIQYNFVLYTFNKKKKISCKNAVPNMFST